MVTNPSTRDWSVTASLFATLNDMYGNRTVCGIGRGDSARRVIGQKPASLSVLRDSMHVIRELAEGREVAHHGAPVRIPWVRDGRLEVWMAAYGPKALQLVGEHADGFILQTADPAITRWTIESVRAAARAAGRDPGGITMCVAAPAYVGEDVAHQRDQLRWFGGMVGNHVADLVSRYGESGPVPARADGLHPGARGLRLRAPRQGGQPVDGLRPGRDRRPVLPGGPGVRARGPADRTGGAGRGPVRAVPDARPEGADPGRLRTGDHPETDGVTGRCPFGSAATPHRAREDPYHHGTSSATVAWWASNWPPATRRECR